PCYDPRYVSRVAKGNSSSAGRLAFFVARADPARKGSRLLSSLLFPPSLVRRPHSTPCGGGASARQNILPGMDVREPWSADKDVFRGFIRTTWHGPVSELFCMTVNQLKACS